MLLHNSENERFTSPGDDNAIFGQPFFLHNFEIHNSRNYNMVAPYTLEIILTVTLSEHLVPPWCVFSILPCVFVCGFIKSLSPFSFRCVRFVLLFLTICLKTECVDIFHYFDNMLYNFRSSKLAQMT